MISPVLKLLSHKAIVGLAPMDGITDAAFRAVQVHIAKPDLIFTEFVSAEGIAHGAVKLFDPLLYSSSERPIIAQLFGKDPQSFYQASIILCHLGFDGIDINMGCPAKTVVQHGSGACLIEKPQLASQIINSVVSAVDDFTSGKVALKDLKLKKKTLAAITRNQKYSQSHSSDFRPTVSVKTRLGTNQSIVDSWIPFIISHPVNFVTLHGRTLKQAYSGNADWDEIKKAAKICRDKNIFLLGNGDIKNLSQAQEFIREYQVDGVLIGRAACGNPWIFSSHLPDLRDKYDAMIYHAQVFTAIFPDRQLDSLRKNFLAYASGHPHAKKLRNQIVHISSLEDIQQLEKPFLNC